METKTKISFDDLDLKVLSEIPLLSEVLTSATNKIVRIFTPIYDKIYDTCAKYLPNEWEIDKKSSQNTIYPFSRSEGKERATFLENYFQVKNSVILALKKDKKWVNFTEVQFGFYYNEEYEAKGYPYFYFQLLKNPSSKFQGKLYPLSYYESIKEKHTDYNFIIEHPEIGSEEEYIELTIDLDEIEKILPASYLFIEEILPDYLQGIMK